MIHRCSSTPKSIYAINSIFHLTLPICPFLILTIHLPFPRPSNANHSIAFSAISTTAPTPPTTAVAEVQPTALSPMPNLSHSPPLKLCDVTQLTTSLLNPSDSPGAPVYLCLCPPAHSRPGNLKLVRNEGSSRDSHSGQVQRSQQRNKMQF